MRSLVSLLFACMLCSCTGELKRDALTGGKYFSGEFVYFADAASVVDCATGIRLPVSNTAAYLEAERGYTSMNPMGPENIFIEFVGHLAQEPKMEGDGLCTVVVIDSLIGFDATSACDPEFVLTGIYEANSREGKRVLRLKSDYTYTESIFYTAESAQESSGEWFRSADMELVLEQILPEKTEVSAFEIVNPQHALTKNSGGEPLVYTKVYM